MTETRSTSLKRTVIKRLRRTINRFGIDVVRVATYHEDISQHLAHVLKVKQIDAVVDVGANNGQYGKLLRRVGFTGWIYSFEPVRAIFEDLERGSAEDAKWHCFNFALADASGKKEINVYDSHVFSSFLDANTYSKDIWESLHGVKAELVELKRLDDVLPDLPGRTECKNFLLKMDTQGYDLNVFRGALASLAHVRALQSELALIALYDGMPDPYQTLSEFNSHGYFISGLYPINRDKSLAVIEYDCILVERATLSSAA